MQGGFLAAFVRFGHGRVEHHRRRRPQDLQRQRRDEDQLPPTGAHGTASSRAPRRTISVGFPGRLRRSRRASTRRAACVAPRHLDVHDPRSDVNARRRRLTVTVSTLVAIVAVRERLGVAFAGRAVRHDAAKPPPDVAVLSPRRAPAASATSSPATRLSSRVEAFARRLGPTFVSSVVTVAPSLRSSHGTRTSPSSRPRR